MKKEKIRFGNRILVWMLLPVLVVGIIISSFSITILTPPLVSLLKNHLDANLKLASNLGIRFSENNMDFLLDLRLEDDLETNAAFQKETVEEIKGISKKLHKIHMIIVEDKSIVKGTSFNLPLDRLNLPELETKKNNIVMQNIWGDPIRMHSKYFPFWNWTIISFIPEADYMAPILLAKRIVYFGTVGVLFLVLLTLYLVFNLFVNLPLKRIVAATKGVADGKLQKLELKREDEIGQLVFSFNAMVESLEKKDADVRSLLEALRESEDRFRTLFENSPLGIALASMNGRILECNDEMFQLLGYSRSEMAQINLNNIYKNHEENKLLLSILQSKNIVRQFEAELKHKNGTTYNARLTASGFILGDKNVYLTVAEDITKEKHLESRLQRAEKMEAIGTLAGGVAHDLNNILSGIVSYPELLLIDLPPDSPFKNPILTIQKSGEKAAAIVQDLLTLARRGVAVKEVVNLNHIISEYLKSPEYEKLNSFHPNIQLETRIEDDILNIAGSPVHLAKTIMNLISNAAEAMLNGGKVTISTKNQYIDKPIAGYDEVKEGDYVVLNVADNGIGISPDDTERIFEPFYTKKAMGRSGTGLGMAVVWGTVKDHDGYIDVSSTEGKGTTFALYFPITRKEMANDESLLSIEDYMGHGESILVIDDVEEQREIASVMLRKLGYAVTSVSSGEEAVEYMKTHSANLLVLDMIMDPGINGRETYERIIQSHPDQNAIIASGFSETDEVKKAQELGAGQYIKKPYTLEKIGMAVKRELG